MASFIELIAKIKQKNNGTFKLVDAQDVECEEGKGLDEVLDEKLDKNLGAENNDKVLITDAEGNIITQNKEDFEGGGTSDYNSLTNKPSINGVELSGNKTSSDLKMYTQEEVDYLLDDKMDKPYVPIEITDNATITDALEGNFKIDMIKGNTYQNVETDIVPTPNRPVPINSRKTLVTKVNPNIFDLEKESDTSNIPDSGTYRSIGQHQLKANTKYIFEWSEATVPAKATLTFQVQDDKGTVLVSPFTYFNLEATEKKETGKQVEFTTNESGIVKFAYNCMVATSSTTETYQQYWYTKILKDISLKEDVEYEPEYVELRSLKETGNLFDINFIKLWGNYSDGMTILDDGTVKVTNNDATLWPLKTKSITIPKSANYTIKYDFETISGGANSGWISLVNMSNDNQKIFSTSGKTLYLDAGDYYVRFYRGQGATDVENNIVQYSNIVLVEGTSAPSTYVPPTVRDYKIVDHTAKTAKIVRNVHTTSFNKNSEWSRTGDDKKGYRFVVVENQPVKVLNYSEVNNGFSNMSNNAKNSVVNDNKSGSGWYCTSNSYAIKVDGLQMGTLDDFKQLLGDNEIIFQCQLQTPTEESITYVETDVSEVGYSWQDTTSPSPSIKSEIYEVNEINIKLAGKNLIDTTTYETLNIYGMTVTYNKDEDCFVLNGTISNSASFFFPLIVKGKKTNYTISVTYCDGDFSIPNGGFLVAYVGKSNATNGNKTNWLSSGNFTKEIVQRSLLLDYEYINGFWFYMTNGVTCNNLKVQVQLEENTEATRYQSYQKTSIQHTLSEPLRATKDGSVKDIIDIVNMQTTYNISEKIMFDGSDDEMWKLYADQNGFYILLNDMMVGRGQQGFCDKFKVVSSASLTGIVLGQGNNYLYVTQVDKYATTIEEWKLWLSQNPITVVYPLVTPTTEPLKEELVEKLKTLKTFSPVTHVFVEGIAKPKLNARYPKDIAAAQAQLEQKVLLMSETSKNIQANLLLQGGND